VKIALIVNPTKVESASLHALVGRHCEDRGWDHPLVLQTTEADPGTSMTRRAVDEGADLVLACGGDGTVAAVATGLAGTGVPLGVLPCGTGNLLARNLSLPPELEPALEVALDGGERTLDLGRIGERRFVVMAGVGFGAAMMADASAVLKRRLGWPAYMLSGLQHLQDQGMIVLLRIDDGPPSIRRARAVLVGNVGHLQGGLALLPDADPGDGVLDVVLVAPRSLFGWLRVAWQVVSGRDQGGGRLERFRARRVEIRTARPRPRRVDGEPLGRDRALVVEVDPGALTVRVAA
jgi:YegS/Rv2252/BmrU family lipid kinase